MVFRKRHDSQDAVQSDYEIVREYELMNVTWSFPTWIIIGGTRENADRRAEELLGSGPDSKSSPTATTWMNDSVRGCVIWFRGEPQPGIASHEALHVVSHIFRRTPMFFSDLTEEAYCYLLQWLVGEIMEESQMNSTWSYAI